VLLLAGSNGSGALARLPPSARAQPVVAAAEAPVLGSLPPAPTGGATLEPATVPPAGTPTTGAVGSIAARSPVTAGQAVATTPAAAPVRASAGGSTGSLPGADRPVVEADRSAPAPPPVPTPVPGAAWPGDFPDPDVLAAGGYYWAYSTEVGLDAVPTIRSVDLVHWQSVGDALAGLPAWSSGTFVWAPSVVKAATGYVMFYATRDTATGEQCISRAFALAPQGPFLDSSTSPFLCQLDQGGDIDPDAFAAADGSQWLLWKSQGTVGGAPPRIWSQRLTGDWTFLSGTPTALLTVSQPWEGKVVEAPDMFQSGADYYLVYSGNNWDSSSYALGYAVCRSAVGPCRKPQNGPLLATHQNQAGPGSATVFQDVLGHLHVAYHAWTPGRVGYPGGARSLRLASLTVADGRLSIGG
jgi:beta-xylosidase